MQPQKLRYIAYIRKSEERQERQELSHAAQERKIRESFKDLNIVKWMKPESKSAFKPGRPVFSEMIKVIESGRADAIVSYHPNRISRNEIDAATVTYMLRTGALKDLKFSSYTFENNPEGIMMLQMIMSQSQYESSKQGRDVSRGMEQKALGGERPGMVPLGYVKSPLLDENGNVMIDSKDKSILTKTTNDPERFELVARMWRLLLSGSYNASQIRKIANEQWGLKSKSTRRVTGKPIGYSTVYRMFTNPFYAGKISHKGKFYDGNHQAMISMEEFDYAQKLLGAKGKPRTSVHGYAYTGLIKCGECGCQIVGKTNEKLVKREERIKTYVHYYCTRKSLNRPCTQSKYTSLEALELEVDHLLSKVTILPEFKELALDILRRKHAKEVSERTSIYTKQTATRKEIQSRIDNLVEMRARDLLSDDEYVSQKNRYVNELDKLDDSLRGTELRADNWLNAAEQAFDFISSARESFRTGDLITKRKIFTALGQNFTLKDQKLEIQPSEWLVPLAEMYPKLESEYLNKVGTKQKATPQIKEMALASVSENWRAYWDSNPGRTA
jgi:DNA invertase Pin-like site-specific DNA recombinase